MEFKFKNKIKRCFRKQQTGSRVISKFYFKADAATETYL